MTIEQNLTQREIERSNGRMVSTMSLGVEIDNNIRRYGNTTRLIDAAIQALFDGKEVVCEDHFQSDMVRTNDRLQDMIVTRLLYEHRMDKRHDFILRTSAPVRSIKLAQGLIESMPGYHLKRLDPYYACWFDFYVKVRPTPPPPVKLGLFRRIWNAILDRP